MNDLAIAAREPSMLEKLIHRIRNAFRKRGPSNLEVHALREFKALGYPPIAECQDDPNKWIQVNVLELLRLFAKQGHSGFSAPYCIDIFAKLARFQPLCPLSGEDDEWNDVSDYGSRNGGRVYQNNRCSHVFKEDGQAYDIDAVVFEEPDGCRFGSYYGRAPVVFPYTPKRVVAKVPKDATEEQMRDAAQQALSAA